MKITRKSEYVPITITIETKEEENELRRILHTGINLSENVQDEIYYLFEYLFERSESKGNLPSDSWVRELEEEIQKELKEEQELHRIKKSVSSNTNVRELFEEDGKETREETELYKSGMDLNNKELEEWERLFRHTGLKDKDYK